jgi:hypothetical protein
MFAPDEGLQGLQEFGAGNAVAGGGARLDESGALPVLAEVLVIAATRGARAPAAASRSASKNTEKSMSLE